MVPTAHPRIALGYFTFALPTARRSNVFNVTVFKFPTTGVKNYPHGSEPQWWGLDILGFTQDGDSYPPAAVAPRRTGPDLWLKYPYVTKKILFGDENVFTLTQS